MALPPVPGWIIDFVSARVAYSDFDNQLINVYSQMCEDGELFCCRCESDYFKEHDGLRPPFIEDRDCRLGLSDEIIDRLEALEHALNGGIQGKRLLPGMDASKQIVATAIEMNFGVISNKTSQRFITVSDMCAACGVVHLTTDQFKNAL
jgi:hypothetical protein